MIESTPVPIPTYCTPEDVAATLDLPSHQDNYGSLEFTDVSHPTYDQVCRMICSNEDIIDRRIRRTWRENYVVAQELTILDYWGDINGWRSDYYQRGGHYIQLRKDVRRWDPRPIFSNEDTLTYLPAEQVVKITADESTGDETVEFLIHEGDVLEFKLDSRHSEMGEVQTVGETPEGVGPDAGKYEVVYHKMVYPGDKLEIRTRSNSWADITDNIIDTAGTDLPVNAGPSNDATICFIDYPYGKVYLRTRLYQQKANAARITYRYGIESPIPAAISRLACLLTAIQVINMQPFFIKVGASGDLGNVRDSMIKYWTDEINSIYTSYQRSGSVHTMW